MHPVGRAERQVRHAPRQLAGILPASRPRRCSHICALKNSKLTNYATPVITNPLKTLIKTMFPTKNHRSPLKTMKSLDFSHKKVGFQPT